MSNSTVLSLQAGRRPGRALVLGSLALVGILAVAVCLFVVFGIAATRESYGPSTARLAGVLALLCTAPGTLAAYCLAQLSFGPARPRPGRPVSLRALALTASVVAAEAGGGFYIFESTHSPVLHAMLAAAPLVAVLVARWV